jgi:para-aminobenzoate synthetase/4-amino-4-deoxychorismate lyase
VNRLILHDSSSGRWLVFNHPVQVFAAYTLADVLPALGRLEEQVSNRGLYAAGLISYEASPAFDPVLRVKPDPSGFPLLWFGLFKAPEAYDSLPPSAGPTHAERLNWTPSVSHADYNHSLSRLRDYLYRGDTYQVNYTFRLLAPFSGDPWSLFHRLVHSQQPAHAAYAETDRFALCSASPELFFTCDGDQLVSRPMKGTAPRGRTSAEDALLAQGLQSSAKNRAENVMIVDMIRNDMGRVALTGSVDPEKLFELERYPTVWQMTSTVRARTRASIREILTALFPCASITGAPKRRTMEIIAELETTPRRIYTGTIGYFGPHRRAEFNVAIRTVLVDKQAGQAEYGVGGGIVWDSDSRDEYDECWTKARILTEEQPEFQLLETLLWVPGERFFLLERHLARLTASADYFGFSLSIPEILSRLHAWEQTAGHADWRVRLLVARRGGICLTATPLVRPASPEPVAVDLANRPIDPSNRFLYHKTTHRRVYDEIRAEHPGREDTLLWNPDGEVTESTIANLVADLDGVLVTPPVRSGLLAGTFREELLANGTIREGVIRITDLPRCRRLYLINSVRKWRDAVCPVTTPRAHLQRTNLPE